jgi:hypothetical protein
MHDTVSNEKGGDPTSADRIRTGGLLPDDSGEFGDALQSMLDRIPPQWGKWIRVRAGWYPLIVELDKAVARLDPTYTLCQVKEKFGALRYYIEPSAGNSATDNASIAQLIGDAERRSSSICEECGAPGVLGVVDGWWHTSCTTHTPVAE